MKRQKASYDHASLEVVAAEIYRRRMGNVPDSELIMSRCRTKSEADELNAKLEDIRREVYKADG